MIYKPTKKLWQVLEVAADNEKIYEMLDLLLDERLFLEENLGVLRRPDNPLTEMYKPTIGAILIPVIPG
jgi:hypothetical protein